MPKFVDVEGLFGGMEKLAYKIEHSWFPFFHKMRVPFLFSKHFRK